MGPIATSTWEMGPGSRHDTLDDHLGHWNWNKLIGLGNLLSKRLAMAIPTAIQLINQVLSSDPPNPLNTTLVENVKLYLPSELPKSHRHGDQMVQLIDIEIKLREGQCYSLLDSLRCKLLVKSRMITCCAMNVQPQGSLTHSQRLLKRIESSIVLYTDKYQTAWDALYRLNGSTTDGMTWKHLRKIDIRIMDEVHDAAIRSQKKKIGRKETSCRVGKGDW